MESDWPLLAHSSCLYWLAKQLLKLGFSIYSPPNISQSLQTVGGWFQDIFPDIFYFYEKIDFLTILALLGLQNVPVGPKNGQNGHFDHFGHFWGSKSAGAP